MTIKELKNKFDNEDVTILIESPNGYTSQYKFEKKNMPLLGGKNGKRVDYAIFHVTKQYGVYNNTDFFINKINQLFLNNDENNKGMQRLQKQYYESLKHLGIMNKYHIIIFAIINMIVTMLLTIMFLLLFKFVFKF